MANTIRVRRSTTTSAVPTTGQLSEGELAVNVYDGKLFFKQVQGASESIVTLQPGGSGITSLNSQTGATQTFATGTAGTDIAFSSSSNTHTLDVPSASTTARGVVTTAAQTFLGSKTVQSDSASTPSLVVKSPASPSGTLQQWQDSAGTVWATVDHFGRIAAKPSTFTSTGSNVAALNGVCGIAAAKGLIVKGAASQTANLLEAQDSAATVLASINSAGTLTVSTNKRVGAPASGTNSVAVGRNALNASACGADANTAVGDYAGSNVGTGYRNTLIGYSANGGNSGYSNTAVGYQAGGTGTSYFENTFVGSNAGDTSNGSRNVFVGYYSGIGSGGVFGAQRVTAVGYAAKALGDYALALGESASAAANSAVIRWGNADRLQGDSSGRLGVNMAAPVAQLHATTGLASRQALIAQGAASQTSNIFEVRNSSATVLASFNSGGQLLAKRTTAPVFNTEAIAAGDTTGQNFVTVDGGVTNTGDGAGVLIRNNGTTVVGIGNYSAAYSGGAYSAAPTLYFNATPKVLGIGTGAGTNAMKYDTGNNQWTYDTSSIRYKDNVRDSSYGLTAVNALQARQFSYKDSGREDVGFIAEELVNVVPELVTKNADQQPDAVSYDRLTAVLCKAIQELSAKVEALEAIVNG